MSTASNGPGRTLSCHSGNVKLFLVWSLPAVISPALGGPLTCVHQPVLNSRQHLQVSSAPFLCRSLLVTLPWGLYWLRPSFILTLVSSTQRDFQVLFRFSLSAMAWRFSSSKLGQPQHPSGVFPFPLGLLDYAAYWPTSKKSLFYIFCLFHRCLRQ